MAKEAAPVEETKAQKFSRLGNTRLAKAMDAIANMRGLANKTNYEYSEEQVKKLFAALEGELEKLQKAFTSPETAVAKETVSIL